MAVNGTTVAASAHLVKRMYMDGQRVDNVANHMHPLFDMVKGNAGGDEWTGDGYFGWTVEWGRNQAGSATFATGIANIDNNKGDRFAFTARRFYYGFAQLSGEVLAAAKSPGAIADATTRSMDQTVLMMKDRLAAFFYGDGGGSIGRRSSVSGQIITLTNADDAKNFQKGQYLRASDTKTGGSLRAGTAVQVQKVTYGLVTSTVTVDAVANITSFADNDYLFNDGDYDAVPRGLEAWIPTSDPASSDSFLGVNRSSDNIRLAGHRLDASSYGTLKEAAQDLAMLIGRIAKGNKCGFLNPIKWEALSKDLGTKAIRDPSQSATFGYDYITQASSCGEIKWYSDVDCPTNRMYILEPETFFLKRLGKVPHVANEDGNIMRAVATTDDYQVRWRFMGDYGCKYPGANGMAQI